MPVCPSTTSSSLTATPAQQALLDHHTKTSAHRTYHSSVTNSGSSAPRSLQASHQHTPILSPNKPQAHTLPPVNYAPIILRLSSALGREASASGNSLRAALLHVTNLPRQSLSPVSLSRQSSGPRAGSGWERGSITLSDILGYQSRGLCCNRREKLLASLISRLDPDTAHQSYCDGGWGAAMVKGGERVAGMSGAPLLGSNTASSCVGLVRLP